MKKIIIGILAVLYLAVSSGVVMEVHYCMGKIAGVELYGSHNDKCGRCGMTEKKNGCCHDEFKIYKLEDSHKNVTSTISFAAEAIPVLYKYRVFNWQEPVQPLAAVFNAHAPPDIGGLSLCVVNCVFRI
jgi:hypothetical protein